MTINMIRFYVYDPCQNGHKTWNGDDCEFIVMQGFMRVCNKNGDQADEADACQQSQKTEDGWQNTAENVA